MVEITLRNVVGYLFGLAAILAGLVFALVSVGSGLVLIIAGVLALPVVRRGLDSRLDVSFSTAAVVGLVALLTVASMGMLVASVLDGSGQSGPTGPGSEVSNVSMTAQDASPPDSGQSLDVVWNARAQSAVDPDPNDMTGYSAEEGQKYLVVRMQLTNTGSSSIEMTPALFRVLGNGVEYEYQALFGSTSGELSGVTLRSGATYDGWVAFSIPDSTTSAELIVHQDAYYQTNTTVQFEKDATMPVNVST
ncbi:DUF4352 domain-containing protein [Halomicroarcula sp. S1AR25-4]|uniref:DUF4352 domain-containing protein n=1 Tax=Haloarcula sp. S1AR25-4 TaxID=2950538 RepID=UPI00287604BA|nr:DUF4352 domain-containing protein [Halomicroarcula sp. S1AR25-4]MDS0280327.1 DUF4352 domain-containing protein [Halomicroarcula sp. S1AR25-4]